MGVNKIAASWGFAEATLFFIVPDVWLSIVGRDNLKKGLIACFYSLIGALLGGALMFWWGRYDFNSASTTLNAIPAIGHEMQTRVQLELSEQGLFAMILGPLSGTPYKVYAIHASQVNIHSGMFLLISIPARLARFVLVSIASHYLSKFISSRTSLNPLIIIIALWSLFYIYYFSTMP